MYLRRDCPEHGRYDFLLSRNGDDYADLDRFFFDILHGAEEGGQITNYWVQVTSDCQQQCPYCSIDLNAPFFDHMTMDDFRRVLDTVGNVKFTLSGGDATAHPLFFDFLQEAQKRGALVQLSTNGLLLASKDYCQRMIDAGLTEVRISYESLDKKETQPLGLDAYYEAKLQALKNLEELGIATILAPTIFRGINESQLVAALQYAKDKPFIREIGVTGFFWSGRGRLLSSENMISPDEMMDVVFENCFTGNREDVFTFEKLVMGCLHILKIRICMSSQIIFFVRGNNKIRPVTEFLAMKRMKRLIKWWERFKDRGRLVQGLAMLVVLAGSTGFRTMQIVPAALKLLWANLRQVRMSDYPAQILTLALNTSCSPPNADETIGIRCMSGIIFVKDGELQTSLTSRCLLRQEKEHRAAARQDGAESGASDPRDG